MSTTMLTLSRYLITNSLSRQRQFHTSKFGLSAEQSPLFLLRKKTGLAYSLCREALNKHDNNVEESEAWLKAHAMAHGLQRASKVRDRSAREGLVCISVPGDNGLATVVELNCETDFVAKNQLFKDFALDITEQVSLSFKDSTSQKLLEQDVICSSKPDDGLLKEIQNKIVPLITKLGENIKLDRAIYLHPTTTSKCVKLFGQIHAQAAKKVTNQYEMMAGRFGAVLALELEEEARAKSHESIKLLGNRLCQHVIGYNPSYIELPANIRKHLEAVEKEKEQLEKSEGIDKDTEDPTESDSSSNLRDEWPSMMDQTLIMSDDVIVRDFCKANGLSILHFNRFECGMDSW